MTKKCRWIALLLGLVILLGMIPVPGVNAEENDNPKMATEISGTALITDKKGYYHTAKLFDGDINTILDGGENSFLTLSHEEGIGSVYLIFGMEHGAYTVTNNDTGASHACGEQNFLHDFLDIKGFFGEAPKSITITFNENKLQITEMRAFTSGQVPDSVQRWDVPGEEMDLLLFSSHGDDEQLFFAGVLPYYGVYRDYEVMVVYLTNHRNYTTTRVHEMLNGLWAVGVTNYPVFGNFPDFFVDNLKGAYSIFASKDITEEDLTSYVVENIRRYKPKVAVGHDPLGEYSHGQHMVYSDVLQKAVQNSMNEDYFPESAEKYGVWDVPKTYLHLYEENPIFMDWDQPLDCFGGMSPFQVSKQLGFYECHVSQVKDFSWYLSQGQTAAEFKKYNPCAYGLFRSTVGEDVQKNDFFENVLSYEEERILQAAEEAERQEAERLAQEEARKKAEEEQTQKLEQEQKKQLELRQAEERMAQEAAQRRQTVIVIGCGAVAVIAVLVLAIILMLKKQRRNCRY